ncbi:MAG: cytochrome P450 [Opitutales bacterium]|nr:cytochrome P450 [Opitutales bacterium]
MSCPFHDAFKEAREDAGVLPAEFQGKPVPMILRYRDVRLAAKDWKTFSSDAPFRVPIPSEEAVRSVRQLPIETDPPRHTAYRSLVEPFFRRPDEADYQARVEALLAELLTTSLERGEVEIVHELALPLQSRALTYLLGVDEAEAEEWIGWGTHVFRVGDGEAKGSALETYLARRFDEAEARPDEDFFSALTRAEVEGRRLTREEMMGFANLVFAGGRDTIINTVAAIFAVLAERPDVLVALRANPALVTTAGEEFFRVASPLTHIGRVCPQGATVGGVAVQPDERVSLCWASANFDESIFAEPEAFRADRRPNPHIAFGSGVHTCLGAAHARLIVRALLRLLAERVERIEVAEAEVKTERESAYTRANGYEMLRVRLHSR